MAEQGSDEIFIGSDVRRHFHVQNEAKTAALDIAGWSLSWMVKRRRHDADAAALLTKTTGGGAIAIAGAFDATPATNAQRATLTLADTDTDAIQEGQYHWELKRMDAGFEAPLVYGILTFRRGVHHA